MIRILVILALVAPAAAYAGCGDVMLVRVDYSELVYGDEAAPREAKLHGAIGWEASPDHWRTHPVGGTLHGFVHLSCASGDAACATELKRFIDTRGSGQALHFTGETFQQGVRPQWANAEGDVSTPLSWPWAGNPTVVGQPTGSEVWTRTMALPVAAEGQPPATDAPPRGCSASGAALSPLLWLLLVRRRRAARPVTSL